MVKAARESEAPRTREHEIERFIGLSLGGAKSDRTCVTVIDHYRKQEKAFVIDVFESIGQENCEQRGYLTADEVLLEVIAEHEPGIEIIATDAPLTLPPCFVDCETSCPGYQKCKKPVVRWMRNQYNRAKSQNPKLKHFTPYSQRPVDLYFRYRHPDQEIFQDETLGANMAPQTARMQYLKRRLDHHRLIEVWPKLTLFYLQKALHLSQREVRAYRNIENGVQVRSKILSQLVEKAQIFIYDRDFKKIVSNISAFDSFLCGWAGMRFHQNKVVKVKSDVPVDSGWVQIPEI